MTNATFTIPPALSRSPPPFDVCSNKEPHLILDDSMNSSIDSLPSPPTRVFDIPTSTIMPTLNAPLDVTCDSLPPVLSNSDKLEERDNLNSHFPSSRDTLDSNIDLEPSNPDEVPNDLLSEDIEASSHQQDADKCGNEAFDPGMDKIEEPSETCSAGNHHSTPADDQVRLPSAETQSTIIQTSQISSDRPPSVTDDEKSSDQLSTGIMAENDTSVQPQSELQTELTADNCDDSDDDFGDFADFADIPNTVPIASTSHIASSTDHADTTTAVVDSDGPSTEQPGLAVPSDDDWVEAENAWAFSVKNGDSNVTGNEEWAAFTSASTGEDETVNCKEIVLDYPASVISAHELSPKISTDPDQSLSHPAEWTSVDVDQFVHSISYCSRHRSFSSSGKELAEDVPESDATKFGSEPERTVDDVDNDDGDDVTYPCALAVLMQDNPDNDEKSTDERTEDPSVPNEHDSAVFVQYSHVWRYLRTIEEALALKHRWKGCVLQEHLLESVGINPVALHLPNPNLPVFARHLGPGALTPITRQQQHLSGVAGGGGGGISGVSSGSSSYSSQGCHQSSGFTSRPSANPTQSSTPSVFTATRNHPTSRIDSLAVPPAEFDWSSSGLSNPLSQGGCGLLDLDYFQLTETTGNNKASSAESALKKDLQELGLDTESPSKTTSADLNPGSMYSNANTSGGSRGTILDEWLKSTQSSINLTSSKRKKRQPAIIDKTLEPELAGLSDHLPDLSFMLNPVLMFPIRSLDDNR